MPSEDKPRNFKKEDLSKAVRELGIKWFGRFYDRR